MKDQLNISQQESGDSMPFMQKDKFKLLCESWRTLGEGTPQYYRDQYSRKALASFIPVGHEIKYHIVSAGGCMPMVFKVRDNMKYLRHNWRCR